jgi:hypothetical protein
MSDDFKIHIFDLNKADPKTKRPLKIVEGKSDRKKINAILVLADGSFYTAGVKNHLSLWTVTGKLAKA